MADKNLSLLLATVWAGTTESEGTLMQADSQTLLEILNQEVSLVADVEMTGSTSLRREAELDSLDFATFLLAVQDRYQIRVPDEEVDKLDTLDAIAAWLNAHLE